MNDTQAANVLYMHELNMELIGYLKNKYIVIIGKENDMIRVELE